MQKQDLVMISGRSLHRAEEGGTAELRSVPWVRLPKAFPADEQFRLR